MGKGTYTDEGTDADTGMDEGKDTDTGADAGTGTGTGTGAVLGGMDAAGHSRSPCGRGAAAHN